MFIWLTGSFIHHTKINVITHQPAKKKLNRPKLYTHLTIHSFIKTESREKSRRISTLQDRKMSFKYYKSKMLNQDLDYTINLTYPVVPMVKIANRNNGLRENGNCRVAMGK